MPDAGRATVCSGGDPLRGHGSADVTAALHTPHDAARWLRERVRGRLHTDSRRVTPGDGFIAWPGAATDGRRFVPAALSQGASACLVEQDGVQVFGLTKLRSPPMRI